MICILGPLGNVLDTLVPGEADSHKSGSQRGQLCCITINQLGKLIGGARQAQLGGSICSALVNKGEQLWPDQLRLPEEDADANLSAPMVA